MGCISRQQHSAAAVGCRLPGIVCKSGSGFHGSYRNVGATDVAHTGLYLFCRDGRIAIGGRSIELHSEDATRDGTVGEHAFGCPSPAQGQQSLRMVELYNRLMPCERGVSAGKFEPGSFADGATAAIASHKVRTLQRKDT